MAHLGCAEIVLHEIRKHVTGHKGGKAKSEAWVRKWLEEFVQDCSAKHVRVPDVAKGTLDLLQKRQRMRKDKKKTYSRTDDLRLYMELLKWVKANITSNEDQAVIVQCARISELQMQVFVLQAKVEELEESLRLATSG